MKLDRYRLLAQLGAGMDGTAYRAWDLQRSCAVEVRVLSAASEQAERLETLAKSLRKVAMLDHPGAIGIRELALDHDPPYAALEWVDVACLADALAGQVPLPAQRALQIGRDLAAALTAAHRLGITHGRVSHNTVRLDDAGRPRLDFTGIRCDDADSRPRYADGDARDAKPRTSSGLFPDRPKDVFDLGKLLFWLLTDHQLKRASLVSQGSDDASPWPELSSVTLPPESIRSLSTSLREMLAADPLERPPAAECESRLAALLGPLGSLSGMDGAADLSANVHVKQTLATPVAEIDPRWTAERDPGDMSLTAPSAVAVTGFEAASLPRRRAAYVSGQCLGRFRLLEKLGEGGMGEVYRAEDVTDGTIVAVKVVQASLAEKPAALRRLHKEARLLAEVNNPYVANLLEMNEDGGVHYLVLEFVAGKSLAALLVERGRLGETEAAEILADVARALVEAHARGIVHRDIKPENILLVGPWPAPKTDSVATLPPGPASAPSARVKLLDFGLARHVVESESLNITRGGVVVGTPLYMPPEQWSADGKIDARADVYAMGATFFHLLTGRPPFQADDLSNLITMHRTQLAPPLANLNPALSGAVCRIVEKALAKEPDNRYSDASALLLDLDRLLRGEPTTVTLHPALPRSDPRKLLNYRFTWELEASVEKLWPYVSNTERLNRAAGLPAVRFTTQDVPGEGARRRGAFTKLGMNLAWEEHAFEWVEPRRLGVVREYTQGPLRWFVSVVELTPRSGGGTTLIHTVTVEPKGVLGRLLAGIEIGVKGRRALDRIYRRIDSFLAGKLGAPPSTDPFEGPAGLSSSGRRRLEALLDRLLECGLDPAVVEPLGEFLRNAPAQEVARIRPLALAHRLGVDSRQLVAACLYGARGGLFLLLWDLLCPVCRIPSEIKETLRDLRDHGHCEACNIDFELEFSQSVEMIFRVHPQVRATELGTYCIGGPAHSPHVAAQVRIAPGERVELELELAEGAYRLRGPQLAWSLDFRVQPSASAVRWDFPLAHGPGPGLARVLQAGRQILTLTNDGAQELLVRVERTASREDAVTAAAAASLALFRELFPAEVLAPGQLARVANVTLLVTDLHPARDLNGVWDDAKAFERIQEHCLLLKKRIAREGGALVKTLGEGVLAVVPDPVTAVQVGLDLQSALAEVDPASRLGLRLAIHRGPAMAATLNDHLDYYGATVRGVSQLLTLAEGSEMILSQAVAADLQVAALLRSRAIEGEVRETDQPGWPSGLTPCLVVKGAAPPLRS